MKEGGFSHEKTIFVPSQPEHRDAGSGKKPDKEKRESSAEEFAAQLFEGKIMETLRASKPGSPELTALKKECAERYPDQLETIEVLFGLGHCLETARNLESGRIKEKIKALEAVKDLTEYQFLWTHHVYTNNGNERYLRNFWQFMERTVSGGDAEEFQGRRKGIITQVAAMRALEINGKSPSLATPDQDAFRAIDLWTKAPGEESVLQIKTAPTSSPRIIETDTMTPIGLEVKGGPDERRTSRFYTNFAAAAEEFRIKVHDYERISGQENLKAYMLAIPDDWVNRTTGEPNGELVEFVGKNIGSDPAAGVERKTEADNLAA